jgi:16S rRNA (cytosine967-C5)-methyltransferase
METSPFRDSHILKACTSYEVQNLPIDRHLSAYFSQNKSIGSKDRAYISQAIYTIMRWKALFDFISKKSSYESRLEMFVTIEPQLHVKNELIPKHIRLSTPLFLYTLLEEQYGEEEAERICLAINTQAPITIRTNTLKISRDKLFYFLSPLYPCSLCEHSSTGITFENRVNFLSLYEFQEGFFEVQDEGSQLLAQEIHATAKDWVLDFCAGSGGKTLAVAPSMEGKGQLFLHDIRSNCLIEAKKRLKRAGIENFQLISYEDHSKKRRLKRKMDWVLVDAPCSGTGTLRRNCDFKWRYTQEMLDSLVEEQRMIFEEALAFLKDSGTIVYATCSLLQEENESQVNYFLEKHGLELVKPLFKSALEEGKMDSFFAASFKKRK